jgi:hypothetical protein
MNLNDPCPDVNITVIRHFGVSKPGKLRVPGPLDQPLCHQTFTWELNLTEELTSTHGVVLDLFTLSRLPAPKVLIPEEFRNGSWVVVDKRRLDFESHEFSFRPVMARTAKLRITLFGDYKYDYSKIDIP